LQTKQIIRAVIVALLYLFFVPALLFISAGTTDWPMAWVYVLLLLASTLSSRLIVLKRNPETLIERARFTSSEGTKAWDRILVMIVALYGPMAIMIVAGLDHRWGWSAIVPEVIQVLAGFLIAGGYGLAVWAMVENRYFSAVARIQKDRGQEVVTTGPYRIVRHPSYAGAILASLALPIMLDAIWSLIPAVVLVVALILRTGLEDRMLRTELDGYQSYAEKTRNRLIPGVW
jgi:protein-S-isoprenylcysteine O-methyltransferase Ste14